MGRHCTRRGFEPSRGSTVSYAKQAMMNSRRLRLGRGGGPWGTVGGERRTSRDRDAAAGRATSGPHRQDLVVLHRVKNMPASRSSTGEQKALLLGLVLAHAELVAERRDQPPILLLDEVAAHLDQRRR